MPSARAGREPRAVASVEGASSGGGLRRNELGFTEVPFQVRLAFDTTAGWEVVPDLLEAAEQRLEGIEVIADERWRIETVRSATPAPFDVGLAWLADRRPGLRFETLRDEPLVVAVGRGHRLSDARTLALSALADERFVTYACTVAPAHHQTVLRVTREAGFEPFLDEQALVPPTVWRMLAARRSIMLIPHSAAPFAAAAGAVTLALEPPAPTVPLELIRPETGTSPAVERLVELAREVVGARSTP